ncbi:FAD-dependent oxidoreductase [Stieleria varia]|nr:FAD-dependent oxidoreductase [Stieleria varia]
MSTVLQARQSQIKDCSASPQNESVVVKQRLVIVGGGMSAFGLCDRLVRRKSIQRYAVTVYGDEPTPAYDRVNLSKLFSESNAEKLLLASPQWYAEHSIKLITGRRIRSIDRESREVIDDQDERIPYDRLILATGSHAFLPPVPGIRSQGVFVYRSLQDLQDIKSFIETNSVSNGVVIGGGLLGLEAAKILSDAGVAVSVVEMAPGLMPRQLDAKGAALLKTRVESMGLEVSLVRRLHCIETESPGRLRLDFENAESVSVGIVIVAAGVRPNDDLARGCGLPVGQRGGIVVDDTLTTADPLIHAIGECVSHRSHVYGLVAPCYRMADVLAHRLSGESATFLGADESAELKLMGVQVATLGRALGDSPGGIPLINQDEHGYRKILLEQGRIVGASCVGDWNELPQVRQAINRQQQMWPWQRRRFMRTGSPWAPSGAWPVAEWPSDSVVCACLGISKGTLTEMIESGCEDLNQLSARCGAATACGSCRPLVQELVTGTPEVVAAPGTRTLITASLVGMLAAVMLLLLPPITMADSVQSGMRSIDVLWRSDFLRQVTGFTLLGVLSLGMLFSLRKRIIRFRWGQYAWWRVLHGILGTATLFCFAVHTGLRLGSNLNLVLSCSFIAAALVGAFSGVAVGLESSLPRRYAMLFRQWRPRLTKWHLWMTWPIPVLIALHVFSFYWFSD